MSETAKNFVNHLYTVFKLCDPDQNGYVKIEYLLSLAENHISEKDRLKEISEEIRLLGIREGDDGKVSFQQFSNGVRAILKKKTSHRKDASTSLPFEDESRRNMPPGKFRIADSSEDSSLAKFSMMSPTMTLAATDDVGKTSPPCRPQRTISNNMEHEAKSQSSSLSDSYEWTAVEQDLGGGNGVGGGGNGHHIDSNIPTTDGNSINGESRSPPSGINRHTWLRTSLRRSSPNHNQENLPNRRWGSFRHNGKRQQIGSNALASSSFNSSGRSSTCDTTDDMYSDASLEEDLHDIHHKVQVLQQQVSVLNDSSYQSDERYARVKAENAALRERVMMLEEQLRDAETRHEDKLQDEQRRSRELLSRMEREKQLQLENASIRLHSAESENANLKDEINRQRVRIEKLETERRNLMDQVQDLTNDVLAAKDQENHCKEQERRLTKEHSAQAQLIEELSLEVEKFRSEARTPALPATSTDTLRLEELHEEMSLLRAKNSQLEEEKEELQASLLHAGLEQGQRLTGEVTLGNSLAAELEAMTQDENGTIRNNEALAKVQQTLREQQEVNVQLRSYIDGILLNIVENYPQLLEVKQQQQQRTAVIT